MSVSGLDPREFDLTDLRRAWYSSPPNHGIDQMFTKHGPEQFTLEGGAKQHLTSKDWHRGVDQGHAEQS